MSRRLIDTNLIVRHLVQDHAAHAETAGRLFAACDRGDVELVILPTVLGECVFVLESFYGHGRADIARTLSALIKSPGVHVDRVDAHVDALTRYQQTKLHFVDCLLASVAVADGLAVATFDQGFRRFGDVQVDVG